MGDAARIRRLAARDLEPDEIAARLKVRPALVRRVLGRSTKRGAATTRGAGTTLSFATSPETAARLRDRASESGVSLSSFIDQTVRKALGEGETPPVLATEPHSLHKPPVAKRRSAPARASKRPLETQRRVSTRTAAVPTTAADAPESVRRLLKSYDLEDVRWDEKNDRHVMVVAILTRGDAAAKRWLWSVLPRSQVRDLVREYRGAGCAEPDRVLLRKQLRLTTADLPTRSYLGLGMEDSHEREGAGR